MAIERGDTGNRLEGETVPAFSGTVLERTHAVVFSGESFENAVVALEAMADLQKFREALGRLSFGSFYDVFESVTLINQAPFSAEEKKRRMEAVLDTLEEKSGRFSPRVSDLYIAILSELRGAPYQPRFAMTEQKISELRNSGDLRILTDNEASWEMKQNRIETRVLGYLSGARSLDRREGQEMDDDIRRWRQEELKKSPTRPPERLTESRPGVDPMERLKTGERAPAIWSIHPAYGGYYKEQSFSRWDAARNVWAEDRYVYHDAVPVPLSNNKDLRKGPPDLVMTALVSGRQWVSLPVPYTHDFSAIETGNRPVLVQKDQNGDLVIFIEGAANEEIQIKVILAPSPEKRFTSTAPGGLKPPEMPTEFSEETARKIEEIKNKKAGNIVRARAVASYVRARVKYLAPRDRAEAERYNAAYRTHPKGFAGAVDEIKLADCDVANTYFAALLSKLAIPVRHIVGHSVKGKNPDGASSIHSGTGHAWSEVWDDIEHQWVRIDTTPPGDSNLEEEHEPGSENIPGDYGTIEAVRPADKELQALQKRLTERKEELSYTREERELSETAGVELKEARQIVREINIAEHLRLPNGELIVDALSRLFNAIVESRKNIAPIYEGPVRQREGGESIENIVRHKIGVVARDADPASREKPAEEIKEEKLIGGFDLYLIGDKSGSMSNEVEGEALWKMQRRAAYLIFSSLHRFEKNIKRVGLQKENVLSVRTEGISFRGSGAEDIDLDKPLSPRLTAEDKVKLWHSLTNQGSANGDVAALSYILDQIKAEIADIQKRGGMDNRLRLIIACSDGGPDSPEGVRQLAENLGGLNAVVVGMGLTETAAAVPIIYDTPHSRGDIARDINDLPALVAKHVIREAVRLFPKNARESALRIIESALDKFKNIG